jgi:hypothetical protein
MPQNLLLILGLSLGTVGAICIAAYLHRRAQRQEGTTKIHPGSIGFLGEQDGPREKVLKSALVTFFESDCIVQKAYLARLDIGEKHTVGLCLKADPLPDESYPDRIGELFIRVMGPGGYLHILFLVEKQEIELTRVCRPFYESFTRSA